MINPSELNKLYYSIGEVAEMFNVNTSLIRFWEKEFPSINPKKNKKGNRLFSPQNILEIQKIFHLVKTEGRTLDGAKKVLKSEKRQKENAIDTIEREELIQKLEMIKSKLSTLK